MVQKKAQVFSFDECKDYMQSLFVLTDVKVSEEQLNMLTTVVEMLNTWNGALNLTAIRDIKDMVQLHILDSAIVSPYLMAVPNVKTVADVGTGAGFPGTVLAILHPELHFTLIDSVGKKLSFVRQVVAKLGLKNVELINKRCEEIQHEPFDCIVSRAFAPLERMVNWCLPLLKEDGLFLAMKGKLEDDEVAAVPETVKIEKLIPLSVPKLDAQRHVVIMHRA